MLLKLLESLIIGASIAAIPGPTFFELIRRTLSKGLHSGVFLVLGEFSGNFLLLLAVFFGVSHLLTSTLAKIILYIIGSIILLIISSSALRLKQENIETSYEIKQNKPAKESFLTGFSIAVSSPIVIALWVSLSGSYLSVFPSKILAFTNILLIAIGVLLFFIPLALIVHKTRHKIPPKYVVLLSKIFGIILIVYGLWLLAEAIKLM